MLREKMVILSILLAINPPGLAMILPGWVVIPTALSLVSASMVCLWKMLPVEAGAVCCKATASCIPGKHYKGYLSPWSCSIARETTAIPTIGRTMHSNGLWTFCKDPAGLCRVLQLMYPGWQMPDTVRVILQSQAETEES